MPASVRIFVSHSHKDEAFTGRLVADLRAAGADVWVDVANITYDDFVGRINEGLSGRDWLVLVMTPEALTSKWVQAEVNAALHLVRQGRMRGVIPVTATPCPDEAIPPLWATLHRYDATRNYSAALAGLLRSLNLPAVSQEAALPSSARSSVPATVPAPASSGGTSPAPTSRARIIVDSKGNVGYTKIGQAIAAANPGDEILVRPGVYKESLVIRKSIDIVGDGAPDAVVIESRSYRGLMFFAPDCRLANLTVRMLRSLLGESGIAVAADEGPLTLERCTVTSHGDDGIVIAGDASVVLRHCLIQRCKGAGVRAVRVIIEDSQIVDNGGDGVVAYRSATLRRNRISGNQKCGVFLDGPGPHVVEDNDLRGNREGAWFITKEAGEVRASGNHK